MKTAAAAIVLAASMAAAEPQHALPSGTNINCAKANAYFCMGGDIILQCNEQALGQPVHCGDSFPQLGRPDAPVKCWESSRDAGDAACASGVSNRSTARL